MGKVTGRPPFRGDNGLAVLRRVCNDTPRPIRDINPDIPEALAGVVDRLLAKGPADRFPSAGAVAELLGRYLAHVQHDPLAPFRDEEASRPVPPRSDRVEQGPRPGRRPARPGLRRPLAVGVAALLVAVALVEGARRIGRTGPAAPGGASVANAKEVPTPLPVASGRRTTPASGAADRPVKVFILAGDSNMAGRPQSRLLKSNPARTQEHFAHLVRDGGWAARDDVWIKFLDRKGDLTVGFGQTPERIGPELEFGRIVGDHFDEQVLLIKACWGGQQRLNSEFRSPSMGPAPENLLEEVRQELRKQDPDATLADAEARCGAMYRGILTEVRQTLADLGEHFPAYRGQGFELAGFVWFSGWTDMVHPNYSYGYSSHLADFIRDVRADLGAPRLPFVIGQMGVHGEAKGKHDLDFRAQQAAVADLPDFAGNVALVATDPLWDREAQAVYDKGWKDHLDEWWK